MPGISGRYYLTKELGDVSILLIGIAIFEHTQLSHFCPFCLPLIGRSRFSVRSGISIQIVLRGVQSDAILNCKNYHIHPKRCIKFLADVKRNVAMISVSSMAIQTMSN